MARRFNVSQLLKINSLEKLSALLLNGKEVRLLVPTNFYEFQAVKQLAHWQVFYRIKPEEIFVIHDELDLLAGTAKLKQGGVGMEGITAI